MADQDEGWTCERIGIKEQGNLYTTPDGNSWEVKNVINSDVDIGSMKGFWENNAGPGSLSTTKLAGLRDAESKLQRVATYG